MSMYALELSFSDDPARLEGRPAHRERLAALRDEGKLLAAGPYADESGALLLFRVESQADADAIVAADPYYSGPGVSVVSLKEWLPVTLAPELG
jgi:uncharacterized protein YciI